KDKKIVFDQRDKRWMDVLEWLSTETGLPLICPTKPTGSFTFIAPIVNGAQKKYTIPEIIDIINEGLLLQKLVLFRREASLMVLPAEQAIDPMLVQLVKVEDLPNRGSTEIVKITYQLTKTVAEDVKKEVEQQMGPFGKVIALGRLNQLVLLD